MHSGDGIHSFLRKQSFNGLFGMNADVFIVIVDLNSQHDPGAGTNLALYGITGFTNSVRGATED